MSYSEIIQELEKIRMMFFHLKSKTKKCKWLWHLLSANEVLLAATVKSIEHIMRATE